MKIEPPAGLPANAIGFIAPYWRRPERMAVYDPDGVLLVIGGEMDLTSAIARWKPWAASEGHTITAEGFILVA